MISVTINASVGANGKNIAKDVKTVIALLNVYLRSLKKTPVPMSGTSSSELEVAIGNFQTNQLKVKKADNRVDVGGATFLGLKKFYTGNIQAIAITAPSFGVVTWESEGSEGGIYHSRCFTVPGASSGLTIGRGYDMKERDQKNIADDLTTAGVDKPSADIIKKAAGLSGLAASNFVVENDMLDFQLTPLQQLALFKISYDEQADVVKNICAKTDVEKNYGKTEWGTLHAAIKDIAIDLKFRGDYTSASRKKIQKSIADNDMVEFKKQIKNQTNWPDVPSDRFNRRVKFIDKY